MKMEGKLCFDMHIHFSSISIILDISRKTRNTFSQGESDFFIPVQTTLKAKANQFHLVYILAIFIIFSSELLLYFSLC